MDGSTIALLTLVVAVGAAFSGALWRVRGEAAGAVEAHRAERMKDVAALNERIDEERKAREVQAMALSTASSLAQAQVKELELKMAEHYVSNEALFKAQAAIVDKMETGFAHINERFDWLREALEGKAPRRRPAARDPQG